MAAIKVLRVGGWRAGLTLAAALLVSGCGPGSYVALLENGDGSTGKVFVTSKQGGSLLDRAYTGAVLDGSSPEPFAVDRESVDRDFGAALAAQPQPPRRFLLHFETGGAELTAESKREIPEVLAEIARRPGVDISVIGHTDTRGDANANEELGLKRAASIAAMIAAQNQNVPITVVSHGETNLLVPTSDDVEEPLNRRVEISVR